MEIVAEVQHLEVAHDSAVDTEARQVLAAAPSSAATPVAMVVVTTSGTHPQQLQQLHYVFQPVRYEKNMLDTQKCRCRLQCQCG